MGYTAGVTARYNTEKNVGLQAELNYVQQGWKEQFDLNPEFTYSRTINYIELTSVHPYLFRGRMPNSILILVRDRLRP